MLIFKVKKTANIISIITDCGTILKTWNEEDFTKRKLENKIKSIKKNFDDNIIFEINI